MTFDRDAAITETRDTGSVAESIKCPRCGMRSRHPFDVAEGYCGLCHDWTSPPRSHRPPRTVAEADTTRLITELVAMEAHGARERIIIGPYTAFLIIGAIHLACRHPRMPAATRTNLVGVATDLSGLFDDTVRGVIERGWNSQHDGAASQT